MGRRIVESKQVSQEAITMQNDLQEMVNKSEKILNVDGHPVHKAKKVMKFIETEEMKKRFRLFYLPPYSPELNPDERVWNDLKNNSIGKQVITTPEQMQAALISHLRFIQKTPARVCSYFNNSTTMYALNVAAIMRRLIVHCPAPLSPPF